MTASKVSKPSRRPRLGALLLAKTTSDRIMTQVDQQVQLQDIRTPQSQMLKDLDVKTQMLKD